MVTIDNEKQNITITLRGDAEQLHDMQRALIAILQGYEYDSIQMSGNNIFHVLNLLKALLPESEQMKQGYTCRSERNPAKEAFNSISI